MFKLQENQIAKLAKKKYWIVDVDGCQYPRDDKECGFYDCLGSYIMKSFIDITRNDPKGAVIFERTKSLLASRGIEISSENLNGVFDSFIPFMKAVNENYPERVADYFNSIYGDFYHLIKPDSRILDSFKLARKKGIEVYFYTNSPSGRFEGEILHTQKVLKCNNFNDDDIEFFRSRTFDLIRILNTGHGKPSHKGMAEFLDVFGIDPESAIMFDDSIENLKTARDFNIEGIWTWTTDEAAKEGCVKCAEEIGAVRVRNTGDAFLKIVEFF